MSTAGKPSANEQIKNDSIYLKGNIIEELNDTSRGDITDPTYELLKFHGTYLQYDRDTQTARKQAGLDKEWQFMVRVKVPGGRMTADQYLQLDKISDEYANHTLRITTRQTIQYHGIIKENLKHHIAGINASLLSTLATCGDVVRNIMCTPAPVKDELHARIWADTSLLAEHCAPKTSAYHEIWVDGENVARTGDNETLEPLYGKHYLPRKFKISVSVPEDNSIDALTHDLAVILIIENGKHIGYNLCLGGGLGMTHNKPETYARLATPIAFVNANELVQGVEAVIKMQREHGDRTNRKHARLKYLVQEKGTAWIREKVEEQFGSKMQDPRPMGEFKLPDHMGWHPQKDGKWFLGVPISSGRIEDREGAKIRTGLRDVVSEYRMNIGLTADQNIILSDINDKDREAIAAKLRSYGITLRDEITHLDNRFLACVSLPTCGLALAEAERVRIELVGNIEKVLEKHGLIEEDMSIRMTGCPNGCARPYAAEVGIVGRMPGHYALFIGGDAEGTRLNTKIFDRVPYDNITSVLDILFARYAAEKNDHEGFGNFCHRVGVDSMLATAKSALATDFKWAA